MPPETAQAIRLLKIVALSDAERRAAIEALADQLEARTSGDAD